MKAKVLFSMALMAMASVALAQSLPSSNQTDEGNLILSKKQLKRSNVSNTIVPVGSSAASKANRVNTRAGEVLYNRPAGTYWVGMGVSDGATYVDNFLYVPSWTDLTYQNASADPSNTKWEVNGNDASEYVVDNNYIGRYGVQQYYMPTLKSKSNSSLFVLGKTADYDCVVMGGVDLREHAMCTTILKGFWMHNGEDGPYTHGSNVPLNDNGDLMDKLFVKCQKPAAPIYVSNIFYPIVSDSENPISNDNSKLTLRILKAATNDKGELVPTDEALFEMTASKSDISQISEFSDTHQKIYKMVFSNKVYDPISGTNVEEPFILNEAYVLELSGFNQPGVDICVPGSLPYFDGDDKNSSFTVEGDNEKAYSWIEPSNVPVMITGYFNAISIDKSATFMKAPDAGGIAVTDEDNQYPFAAIFTTMDWSEDNFFFEPEKPDWISIEIDDSQREKNGYYVFQFECDPLPAGETTRFWTTNINTFGYTSTPITIYQGKKPDVGIGSTPEVNNVKVVNADNAYVITYPETITKVEIINAAGQVIEKYDLPTNGNFTLSSDNLSNGIYLLKFNDNQTIKIIK